MHNVWVCFIFKICVHDLLPIYLEDCGKTGERSTPSSPLVKLGNVSCEEILLKGHKKADLYRVFIRGCANTSSCAGSEEKKCRKSLVMSTS